MPSNVLIPEAPGYKNEIENMRLKIEWLDEIAMRVLSAYKQTTLHDASNAPGSYAYFAAVRATREVLSPYGWIPKRQHNLELAVQPDIGIAILTSSGDENTGIPDIDPTTKNKKGKQTHNVVRHNSKQLSFWPNLDSPYNPAPSAQFDIPTWMFLYHIDKDKLEMRVELSLPVSLDLEKMKVNGWQSRIILSPVSFDPTPIQPKQDFAPEIEFEIKRKI